MLLISVMPHTHHIPVSPATCPLHEHYFVPNPVHYSLHHHQVKSAQQLIPLPEVREIISTARGLLEEGNLAGAFELTHDASQLLHQVRVVTTSGEIKKYKLYCNYPFTPPFLVSSALSGFCRSLDPFTRRQR